MNEITRVGADLAKRVIQVHAVDTSGKLVTQCHWSVIEVRSCNDAFA